MTATTRWDMAFRALPGIPLVEPGENLPALIVKAAENDGFSFADGDVLVVAQKIVSKAERHIVRLDDVTPSEHAQKLGRITGRDARLCQLYLDESKAIIEIKGRHMVTIHRGLFRSPLSASLRPAFAQVNGPLAILTVEF